MSDGFRGFAWVLVILGGLFTILGLFWSEGNYLIFGIAGIVTSIPLFISASFCRIMEDTRDTLHRIETLLQNRTEE